MAPDMFLRSWAAGSVEFPGDGEAAEDAMIGEAEAASVDSDEGVAGELADHIAADDLEAALAGLLDEDEDTDHSGGEAARLEEIQDQHSAQELAPLQGGSGFGRCRCCWRPQCHCRGRQRASSASARSRTRALRSLFGPSWASSSWQACHE